MKKLIIACSVAAVTAVVGVRSMQAEVYPVDEPPSQVTGGSWFLDIGANPENPNLNPQEYKFSVNIDPERSPQAVVRVDGPGLREYWGGPLILREDYSAYLVINQAYDPPLPKPLGQQFRFLKQHPLTGDPVQVWIYAHDNVTPGNNRANPPAHLDWFGVIIEPQGGDGWPNPYGNDDLFTAIGVLIRGNIMDHRE